MGYVDLSTIHVPATNASAPAAWGLQVRDNFAALASPPACRVWRSAALSCANNADTAVIWDSEATPGYDPAGMFTPGFGLLVAPVAGLYHVSLCVPFAPNSVGTRGAAISLNGTTTVAETRGIKADAQAVALCCSTDVRMAASDFVLANAFQNSGGLLAFAVGAQMHMTLRWVAV